MSLDMVGRPVLAPWPRPPLPLLPLVLPLSLVFSFVDCCVDCCEDCVELVKDSSWVLPLRPASIYKLERWPALVATFLVPTPEVTADFLDEPVSVD